MRVVWVLLAVVIIAYMAYDVYDARQHPMVTETWY